jgi:hypothetical protein
MAFMVPEYVRDDFVEVENKYGEMRLIPADIAKDAMESDEEITEHHKKKIFARLSAPGYMDSTDWGGPFDTIEEARKYIEDLWEVDSETGEDLWD